MLPRSFLAAAALALASLAQAGLDVVNQTSKRLTQRGEAFPRAEPARDRVTAEWLAHQTTPGGTQTPSHFGKPLHATHRWGNPPTCMLRCWA